MLPDFRVRQRDYLLEISRSLAEELDLDKLLDRILTISIEMLAGKAGLVALRSETGEWQARVSHALPQAFLTYLASILSNIRHDPDTPDYVELPEISRLLNELAFAASLGLLTGVGLPLIARKKIVGGIFIFRGYQGVFSQNDRAILSSFADQAAVAVQNTQLYTQIINEKRRMDALLDSAADGILILTPGHHIEKCNYAFSRMMSQPILEIQEMTHEQIIRWKGQPQGLTLEDAEAGGWPLTPQAQLYVEGDLRGFGEGTSIPVGITYAPLLSAEGTLINVIVTVRDITRFRQADELKSTFISIISHELKTPVALIKGYVGTLRREDATWDREIVQDSLEVIEEEADRLTKLIENLLDASRLEAGGLKLKLSDTSIPNLAKRLTERFKIQSKKHRFIIDFPDDFPITLVDETRLEQVLSNLLSNAIKYSPQGNILIRGQTNQNNVIVCVSDQGPGIAPGDMPHIFDRFYRAPDTARQTKGAGLGLYLGRAIIEAHGGRIWIDSETDKGSRICFSLPRHLAV